MDHEEVLFIVSRQAPTNCATFSLPVVELLERGGFKREQLVAAIGSAALVRQWRLTLDDASDRVVYQKTDRSWKLAPMTLGPRGMPARPAVATAPKPPLDPVAVGKAAGAHVDAERKAGRAVSASQAVDHVLRSSPK